MISDATGNIVRTRSTLLAVEVNSCNTIFNSLSLSISLSLYLSISLSLYLSLYISLSVSLSLYLYISLSISLSLFSLLYPVLSLDHRLTPSSFFLPLSVFS